MRSLTATETCVDTYLGWLDDEAVAPRIRERIRQETPVYATFADSAEEDAWAAGIDAGLATFVSCARENRGLDATEQAMMEAIGRRRAEQDGMTLDAIDSSIRVAVSVALDFVIERIPVLDAASRDALRELSARLTRYGNEITAAAVLAFLARREELATKRVRADARLFADVLGGGYDHGEVVGRSASQGIDLATTAWAGVLVTPGSGGDALHELETNLLASLPHAVAVPMATAAVPHAVVVFQAGEWGDACRVLESVAGMLRRTLLTTGPCVGPERLRRRYISARSLLPYLPDLADDDELLDVCQLLEVALLTEIPADAKRAYLEEVLGPVDELSVVRRRRLLQTIEAVAKHGKAPKAVAAAVGVNVKTVRRHIEWFEEQTGLCLDRPEHFNRLLIGLHLRKVARGGPLLA